MEGFEVQTGETLGMAQRGGPVVSYVRYGTKIHSSLVPDHEANVLISLEPVEAIRSIRLVGRDTVVLLNTKEKRPLSVQLGEQKYPRLREIEDSLQSAGAKTFAIDATGLAEQAGNAKSANVCLFGGTAALGSSHIQLDNFKNALKEQLSKQLEVNLRAFGLGYEAINALIQANGKLESIKTLD
jgi:indolepyruvate ferredoxin oxidoreductase beta subunit